MAAGNQRDIQYGETPHCPICLGKFKSPRQLPCLHSFCECCMEDYISSKAVNMDELSQFECPVCRTEVPVSRKGKTSQMWVSLFPIDSILQSIGGKEKEEVNRHCDCCLSDGVPVTANGFCVVCEEAMCASCIKVHQKQKVSKHHSIITTEELTNNPKNIIRFDKCFRCEEHASEDLKFYCRDHTIACCARCCIAHHRNCSQVFDLIKDANNLLQEVKPLQILEKMNKIEEHLINIEKRNDSNIASLESQVQEMTNKIQEIRKKLNDLLDGLEHKVKSEGNQMYKQEAVRKQEENRECQALLNAVRNSHLTLETIMKHGSDTQIFITADRMLLQVKLYHEQIKEKLDVTETVKLSLEFDQQIQCILAQRSNVGRVIYTKERERSPMLKGISPLKECQVEMEEVVQVKGPDDKEPWYAGVTHLQEDQLMLVDYNNKRVLLLNSLYQCIASLTLPGRPDDICAVDHEKVAICLRDNNTLQFLSVTSGTIKPTRTVKTRFLCWGVTPAGNGRIVVSGECYDKSKLYWSLVNSTGKEEKCHTFDPPCENSSTYVTLNSAFTRVYITAYQANTLYCFDMDGMNMYVYSTDSLKGPYGVATDRDDNVYVVGCISRNIHNLMWDGSPIRVITDGIPISPTAISFNTSRDKFLLTNNSIIERTKLKKFRFK